MSFWCVPLSVTDVKTINYLCLWVTRFLWPDQRRGVNMILSRWRILWHRKNWQSWGECEMKGLNIYCSILWSKLTKADNFWDFWHFPRPFPRHLFLISSQLKMWPLCYISRYLWRANSKENRPTTCGLNWFYYRGAALSLWPLSYLQTVAFGDF